MCHTSVETAAHRYYFCPALRRIEEDDATGVVAKTRWMARKVQTEWKDWPCLYARALLPKCCWDIVPPDQLPKVARQVGDFHAQGVANATLFSDGAGGSERQPPHLRRAGAGSAAAKVEWRDGSLTVVAAALARHSVLGLKTVPRAELLVRPTPLHSRQGAASASLSTPLTF